jgi:hypothetical protein
MTVFAGAIAATACAAALPQHNRPDRHWTKDLRKTPATPPAPSDSQAPVADLPHAPGRTFATLDAYLAYLRDYAGPTGRPWYREIGPGMYRYETGNFKPLAPTGQTPPRQFTREELERRFGFRK